MLKAKFEFSKNLISARAQNTLYLFLSDKYQVPLSFEDLLRSQIVYSLSAFDKFMHDVIRIGIVDIYKGNRPTTPRYLSEEISIELHRSLLAASIRPSDELHSFLLAASIPPSEIIFECLSEETLNRMSHL